LTQNPILDELRVVRERLLADAGGTLDALVDRLQAEERQSVHPRFKPRRTAKSEKSGGVEAEGQLSPPGGKTD
jgi:hypothetical protein